MYIITAHPGGLFINLLHSRAKVLVAVSGGKDSLSLWDILWRMGYHADGLYLGLGIDGGIGYSDESHRLTENFAIERGLTLHVVDVEHDRGGWRVSLGEVKASLLVELRESGAGPHILEAVRASGFDATPLGAPDYARARARGVAPGTTETLDEDGES